MLELVARHPGIDAIVYLGLGIQSNQAQLMQDGPFYPDDGLERIVAYHERQDARFARAAAEISDATGKPILTATELAIAAPDNPGPRDRPRDRTPLLRRVEPRGHRARASPAVRPVARTPRTAVTDPIVREHRVRVRRRVVAAVLGVGALVLIFLGLQGPGSPRRPTSGTAPRDAALVRAPRAAVDRRRSSASSGCSRRSTRRSQGLDACFVVDGAVRSRRRVRRTTRPASPRRPRSSSPRRRRSTCSAPTSATRRRPWRRARRGTGRSRGSGSSGRGTRASPRPKRPRRLAAEPLTKGDQTTPLAALADEIVAAGVRAIPGGIEGDDSRYEGTRYLSVWPDALPDEP